MNKKSKDIIINENTNEKVKDKSNKDMPENNLD